MHVGPTETMIVHTKRDEQMRRGMQPPAPAATIVVAVATGALSNSSSSNHRAATAVEVAIRRIDGTTTPSAVM